MTKLGRFIADYVDVMPTITGRSNKQVEVAAHLLSSKLRTASRNIAVLHFFDKELNRYVAHAKNYKEHEEIVTELQTFITDCITKWNEDIGDTFK